MHLYFLIKIRVVIVYIIIFLKVKFYSLKHILIFLLFLLFNVTSFKAQSSIARDWNEELLEAIRNDFARPTVHARNLFHSSILMYDAWALFNDNAETLFLGKTFGAYSCNFNGISSPADSNDAIHRGHKFCYVSFSHPSIC